MLEESEQNDRHTDYVDTTFIRITPEGVPDDYENVWQLLRYSAGKVRMLLNRGASSEDIEQARKNLNTPVQTYAQYTERYYPPEFRKRIAPKLNLETIRTLDALAAEFNALAEQGSVTHELAQEFVDRAHAIISGKSRDA